MAYQRVSWELESWHWCQWWHRWQSWTRQWSWQELPESSIQEPASSDKSTAQWSWKRWRQSSIQELASASCEDAASTFLDLWVAYDSSKIDHRAMCDVLITYKNSKRETQLRAAFNNYGRQIKHRLKRAKLRKKVFGRWAAVWSKSKYESKPTLEDLLWTDDDMMHFLHTQVTFKSHDEYYRKEKFARTDYRHEFYGKTMPIKMTPSLIKVWQFILASAHSEQYWQNFGDMSVSRLTHTPFPVLLEEAGEEFKPTKPEKSLLSLGAAASSQMHNEQSLLVKGVYFSQIVIARGPPSTLTHTSPLHWHGWQSSYLGHNVDDDEDGGHRRRRRRRRRQRRRR